MEDFVTFELAVKLKEKGFSCEYPFAMYNEDGEFYPLYSSDKYYYEISDFDSRDFIAPTISQVLKWLREEKKLHISIEYEYAEIPVWDFEIRLIGNYGRWWTDETYSSYEQATLAGIEYVLDNLI